MGYTHYWGVRDWESPKWQEAWAQLIKDVPKIIEETKVKLSGPTDDEDVVTPVVVDIEEGIYLNGAQDGAYEPFIISKKDTGSFNFCKTARRPYDAVVTCILLRAWMLAPDDFGPSSDGGYEDWKSGRQLYESLWPGESVEGFWKKRVTEE